MTAYSLDPFIRGEGIVKDTNMLLFILGDARAIEIEELLVEG